MIVEPSQFFQNDLDSEGDSRFHGERFSEHPIYKEAHKHARQELAEELFGAKWPMPQPREIKFVWSAFQHLNSLGYKVSLMEMKQPFGGEAENSATTWINTIIGEFNMTLRNVPLETLHRMSPDKLHLFYDRFRKYLQAQHMPEEPPPSRIYVILVQRNVR